MALEIGSVHNVLGGEGRQEGGRSKGGTFFEAALEYSWKLFDWEEFGGGKMKGRGRNAGRDWAAGAEGWPGGVRERACVFAGGERTAGKGSADEKAEE